VHGDRMQESMHQLLERYPLTDASTASAAFPLFPPSLLSPPGGAVSLHPLLGVPVLRNPAAELLAQQYLWALAASAGETSATSATRSDDNEHSTNRSVGLAVRCSNR